MLNEHDHHPVRIIGIGNPLRGDDGAGHLVIDLLKENLPGENPGLTFEKYGDNLIDIVSTLDKDQTLIIIDTAVSGKSPGKINSYKLADDNLQTENIKFSTHALNPLQMVKLAKNLGRFPENSWLYLVEGSSFKYENALNLKVEKSVFKLVKQIQQMISDRNFKIK